MPRGDSTEDAVLRANLKGTNRDTNYQAIHIPLINNDILLVRLLVPHHTKRSPCRNAGALLFLVRPHSVHTASSL